ncbi:MAG TPA: hypothetical protein VNR59_06340 [Gaiellaceae bacterium]|nr:hypothetical protein [Gaiellaceae bacterium]
MTTPFASRSRFTVLAGSMVALLAAGCAHGSYETTSGGEVVRAGVARRPVSDIIATLPDKQRETATLMRSKYGEPTVAGDGELVWYTTGPFVKTAIARDAAPHNFPMPHTDYLTQTVRHRVPADKLAALNEYDGSVIYHRTRGELSAQCDKEEMNFLALNLAHDIITGKRTVDDARAFYAKTAMAFKQGDRSSPYVNGLLFQQEPNAADPDPPPPM